MGIFAFLVVAFTFIANLVIGLVVYRNNPKSWTNRLTAGLALIFALWTVFNYFALLPGSESTRIFWVRMVMLVTTPMGLFTYYLAKSFPQDTLNVSRRILVITIPLTVIIALLSLTPLMFAGVENLPNGSFNLIPGPAIVLFAISHLGFTTLGLVILIRKYLKSTGLLRKQLFFFILGTVLTLTLITLTNFIAVVFFNAMQYTFIGPTFTLFQVGFLTYAILRHRLFDVRILVMRTVTYTLLFVTSITMIIAAIVSGSQLLASDFNATIFYTIITLVFALLFNPLKNIFEKATKNIFYQEAYSSEELLESLGAILRSTLSITTLTTNVLKELSDTMHLTRAAFYLKNDEGEYHVRSIGYDQTPSLSDNTIHNLTTAVKNELLVFDELDESAIKMLMRQNHVAVAIPLRVKSTHHGLLILEDKSSGEIYSQQDIDVLEIFAPQISVAIQNALSYDEIKHFADTLKEEVRIATTDLRTANRRLKHLDKIKNEFIFIATHELKNPVTAMRGYLSMINEGFYGKIPDKVKDPLNQINNSNQQLVELVNDLLQIARSEAKTLTVKTEKVDLCSTIDAVCGSVKSLLDQKGLKLSHVCPNRQHVVIADPIRLKEIVNNLVSNAIKYSEKGTISITHELEQAYIITHVQDQGVGIAKKDQEKLFTRFYRVEEQAAKGIPGTGLGLYIIKQEIEKMGGKIWFSSTVGQGSTFSFSLPQA